MKFLLTTFSLVLIANICIAQSFLNFNKRFGESEKRWVVFPIGKDSTYTFGYIYLDDQAGFTFDYKGDLKIAGDSILSYQKKDLNGIMKYRLQPNNVRVAFLPESYFSQLGIQAFPDFIKYYYESDSNTVQALYRKGFQYNAFNESKLALGFLERARKINPLFKGLPTELAFTYNALGLYSEAIKIAEEGINTEDDKCYLYKELAYAQINSDKLDDAIVSVKKGLKKCNNESYKTELPFNIAGAFYRKKNKEKFNEWKAITLKYAQNGDMYFKQLSQMEADLNK